jgi:MOSC domain-containing protein YiiM
VQTLGSIVGVFAGGIALLDRPGKPSKPSAIKKRAFTHVHVEADGIVGDASFFQMPSAPYRSHRTPDKALHIFTADSYERLESTLDRKLPRPTFGENILADGFGDADLFPGDHLKIGTAEIEITQPTERCGNPGFVCGIPDLLDHLKKLEITGCYARVLVPGTIANSDRIHLLKRTQAVWSIAKIVRATWLEHPRDTNSIESILTLPELSDEWKLRLKGVLGQ